MSDRFVFCPGPRRVVVREASGASVARGPTHENIGFEVDWIERGVMGFELGARALEASAGACVVIPPAIVHTPRARSTRFHQITLPTEWIEEAAQSVGGSLPRTPELRVGRVVEHARLVAEDIAAGIPEADPGVQASLYALCVSLVRPARAPSERIDRRVRRALDCIGDNYAERLTIDDLATAAGMSRFAFVRAFRASVGESPYRHLTNVRLERAASRLRTTRDSVLAIALSCGFTDPGRFARAFRARYGCTPLRFRQQTLNS